MARVDFGLSGLIKGLQSASDAAAVYTKPINHLRNGALRLAKQNTAVKKGLLRRSWFTVRRGATTCEIINPTEYAAAYNYGHRQTPGRYVPALGKRLKSSFVPGAHVLAKTLAKAATEVLPVAQKMVLEEIKKRVFGRQ